MNVEGPASTWTQHELRKARERRKLQDLAPEGAFARRREGDPGPRPLRRRVLSSSVQPSRDAMSMCVREGRHAPMRSRGWARNHVFQWAGQGVARSWQVMVESGRKLRFIRTLRHIDEKPWRGKARRLLE